MRVLKKGARVSDSQLSFALVPNECGEARLGLAIAKRVIPLAADRNAIKRQVREAFRYYPGLPCVDIVVLTRRSTQIKDPKKIRISAESLFKKIEQGNYRTYVPRSRSDKAVK